MVQPLSRVQQFAIRGLQHSRPPCPSQLPGFVQTHVHGVSDAIQPSHPQSSPSRPALDLSQHQGLFQRVGSSYQLAKLLVDTDWNCSFSLCNLEFPRPGCLFSFIRGIKEMVEPVMFILSSIRMLSNESTFGLAAWIFSGQ